MPALATMPTAAGEISNPDRPRRFDFERDTFAFANELHWAYSFDRTTGRTSFVRRDPPPDYAHRCFVLTCAARKFRFHATFDPAQPRVADDAYRRLVRAVLARSPRHPSAPRQAICFPGYESLRQFSRDQEPLLKAECGGAWRSYVLRSHWRMVFPISRAHQGRTASQLVDTVGTQGSAMVHLVRFPKLSINHGMILFQAHQGRDQIVFDAYDPNDPRKPASLSFDLAARTFRLPANAYWAGGDLDVIEICRNWFL